MSLTFLVVERPCQCDVVLLVLSQLLQHAVSISASAHTPHYTSRCLSSCLSIQEH